MNRTVLIAGITGVISLTAGAISGYFFAKRKLEEEYAMQLQEELQASKEFYAKLHKTGPYETPEKAEEVLIKDAVEAVRSYQGQIVDYHAASRREEEIVRNVFAETSSTQIEQEIAARTEEAPYIISIKEFSENEEGHEQSTLTYYEEDGVLADEKEENIPHIDETVGDNNIHRFGHRSENPDALYVRNHRIGMDFEILRKPGSYKQLVLGMTD